MNEIERALGRLEKAVDHLRDRLDNNMSTSFLDDREHSTSRNIDAQMSYLSELGSIKRQISSAISLMEQLTSEMDQAPSTILVESKKDHQ